MGEYQRGCDVTCMFLSGNERWAATKITFKFPAFELTLSPLLPPVPDHNPLPPPPPPHPTTHPAGISQIKKLSLSDTPFRYIQR